MMEETALRRWRSGSVKTLGGSEADIPFFSSVLYFYDRQPLHGDGDIQTIARDPYALRRTQFRGLAQLLQLHLRGKARASHLLVGWHYIAVIRIHAIDKGLLPFLRSWELNGKLPHRTRCVQRDQIPQGKDKSSVGTPSDNGRVGIDIQPTLSQPVQHFK